MAIRFASQDRPLPKAPPIKPTPVKSVMPMLSAEKRGRGRPPSGKEIVTIRFDADLVAHYRATGDGWQSRMNDDLRKAAGL